jgi:hypothetical protein
MKIRIPSPLDTVKWAISKAQEVNEYFLAGIKRSRKIHALNNAFNYEMKGHEMGGHHIRRFNPTKTTAAFAAFAKFPALAALSVIETLETINKKTMQQITALRTQYIENQASKTMDNSLTVTFAENVDVAKPVHDVLLKDVFAFEAKRDAIIASVGPDFIGPSRELFELYRDAPQIDNLSVLFNPDGQAAYMHCAEKVDKLSLEFKAQVALNPELEKVPTINIMTFSMSAIPKTPTDQSVIRLVPARPQTGEPAPVYAHA